MAHFGIDHADNGLGHAQQRARQASHIHHVQIMLVAASIAAAGIVAVAATMMTTLF